MTRPVTAWNVLRAGVVHRRVVRRGWRPPRWLLLQTLPYTDALVTFTHRAWWVVLGGTAWRVLVALGVWEVEEGGYYRDGHLCLRPWRNPASAWCLGWRRALWPWKG